MNDFNFARLNLFFQIFFSKFDELLVLFLAKNPKIVFCSGPFVSSSISCFKTLLLRLVYVGSGLISLFFFFPPVSAVVHYTPVVIMTHKMVHGYNATFHVFDKVGTMEAKSFMIGLPKTGIDLLGLPVEYEVKSLFSCTFL